MSHQDEYYLNMSCIDMIKKCERKYGIVSASLGKYRAARILRQKSTIYIYVRGMLDLILKRYI